MKKVASFLIDNKGGFVYSENPMQTQIRVMGLQDSDKISALVKLAEAEGLSVNLQGGVTITKSIAPVFVSEKKKKK